MSHVADVLRAKGGTVVLTVPPDAEVARVAQRMRHEHVGAFVVSPDGRRCDGIITERDIVNGIARSGPACLEQRVSVLMSPAVHTCHRDDSVRSVMRTMTDARVRHLPVIERGELCGMISIGDVIKTFVDDADLEHSVMRDAYIAHRSR